MSYTDRIQGLIFDANLQIKRLKRLETQQRLLVYKYLAKQDSQQAEKHAKLAAEYITRIQNYSSQIDHYQRLKENIHHMNHHSKVVYTMGGLSHTLQTKKNVIVPPKELENITQLPNRIDAINAAQETAHLQVTEATKVNEEEDQMAQNLLDRIKGVYKMQQDLDEIKAVKDIPVSEEDKLTDRLLEQLNRLQIKEEVKKT